MYREKYGFNEPPKQLQDAFARVGIQYNVRLSKTFCALAASKYPLMPITDASFLIRFCRTSTA